MDSAGGNSSAIASLDTRGELGALPARPNAFATYGYNPNSCFVVNSSRTGGLQGDELAYFGGLFKLLYTEGCITGELNKLGHIQF
jgi:hypothetical protein